MAGPGDDIVNRRDADDLAGRRRHFGADSLLEEKAGCFAGAQELAAEVDVDDGFPVLKRHVDESGIALHARVVDRMSRAAPSVEGGGKQRLHLVFAADVGPHGQRLAARRDDAFDHLASSFVVADEIDDYLGAGRGQAPGDRGADAGTGAGDDGPLAVKRPVR